MEDCSTDERTAVACRVCSVDLDVNDLNISVNNKLIAGLLRLDFGQV